MRQTHLEFYKQHGIAPVCYDMSSMDAHMDRRESLYNMLGLLPIAFRGAKVLEVAAGTGHNSLYIAAQSPDAFILLEPNPTAVKHINDTYSCFDRPHTQPEIIVKTLEEYDPEDPFDIVICENWLGTSEHELKLLQKLTNFVAQNGVLIVTVVSPIGFVPNLLRRFFVPYLAPVDLEFEYRTEIIEKAYGPHLRTLSSMTRNVKDWVMDNMLNPAYFGLCLSAPMVIEQLPQEFEVIGAYPSFAEDWRWFKGLYGEHRRKNEHFLQEYWLKCHNFMDSRIQNFPSDPVLNKKFEQNAFNLLNAIETHEDAFLNAGNINEARSNVAQVFDNFVNCIPETLVEARSGMNELRPSIDAPTTVSIDSISGLKEFSGLFGRETSYISFKRR